MSDKINEAIQDIVVKHGVLLSKDDPVLILQTMNEKLLEENRKAQQEMLVQFKEEMENISSQWKDDANKKAEKILNSSLTASKDVMSGLLRESMSESVHNMKKMIKESLEEIHDIPHRTQKYKWREILSLTVVLTASSIILQLFIFHIFS